MNAAIARLPAKQQRALAIALLVVAVVRRPFGAAAAGGAPAQALRRRDRRRSPTGSRRYRRVAAQAPEYRKALDVMREKDGRRFFLKNTAANLAGAELQELVRAAIESNGGRITTSQNQAAEGRRTVPADRRQRAVLRDDAQPAEDPVRARGAAAVPVGREHDAAAAQRVSRLPARARAGAGGQRPARRRRVRVRRDRGRNSHGRRDERAPHACAPRCGGSFRCWSRSRSSRGRPISGARVRKLPPAGGADSRRSRWSRRCCPSSRSSAAPPRTRKPCSGRCSIRRAVPHRCCRSRRPSRGCSAASSR